MVVSFIGRKASSKGEKTSSCSFLIISIMRRMIIILITMRRMVNIWITMRRMISISMRRIRRRITHDHHDHHDDHRHHQHDDLVKPGGHMKSSPTILVSQLWLQLWSVQQSANLNILIMMMIIMIT